MKDHIEAEALYEAPAIEEHASVEGVLQPFGNCSTGGSGPTSLG